MESSDIVTIVRKMPQTDKIPIILYSCHCLSELNMEDGRQKIQSIAGSTKYCMEIGATFSLGMYSEQSFIKKISVYLKSSV